MKKRTPVTIDMAEIPEVVDFIDARSALDDFRAEHAAVFGQLQALTERYNSTLEQADKACRARQISCGPFQLYQFSTKYDAEALYNAVGRDQFLTIGGKVETKTVYDVDRNRLEAAIAQNKLPTEVVEAVRREVPSFHKPDKVVLP